MVADMQQSGDGEWSQIRKYFCQFNFLSFSLGGPHGGCGDTVLGKSEENQEISLPFENFCPKMQTSATKVYNSEANQLNSIFGFFWGGEFRVQGQ